MEETFGDRKFPGSVVYVGFQGFNVVGYRVQGFRV